jgi:DNA-binding response OmpR family regulator
MMPGATAFTVMPHVCDFERQCLGGELAQQLLLLDIRMPGLDGFELLRVLAVRGVNP